MRAFTRREVIGLAGGATAALAFGRVAAAATPEQLGRMPLGTNLGGLVDWSPEFSFVNFLKQSRRWFSGTATTWQDSRALDVDAHGWVRSLAPGQWARTTLFMHRAMLGRYPTGRYVLTYTGQGTFAYTPNARVVERAPGREVIEVENQSSYLGLYITSVVVGDHPRDMALRPPGDYAANALFYPPFLDTIKNYRVIRFHNWALGQGTAQNFWQEHWSERPTVHDAQWSVKGAPVEVMTALSNRLRAGAWFTIPCMASDDYVYQFALRVRDTLDPTLRVYFEYANEIWNPLYFASGWCRDHGLALGLSADPGQALLRYQARRSKEIFRIVETVLPPTQLVRVISAQSASPWASRTMLSFEDTRAHVDALSHAPYFMVRAPNLSQVVGMNLDQLFAYLETVSLEEARTMMRWQADVAREYALPLVAYEGGQHLTTLGPFERDQAMGALFQAANRDPRMGRLYDRYFRDWNELSGQGLFMHLGNCAASDLGGLGYFGSLEYLTQPRAEAPKYDALQRWIEGR